MLFRSGLDFLVVQDVFATKTAELADVILPGTLSWCETDGTVTNSERRVQRVRKALDPPGEARDDQWILSELARRLGFDWNYGSSEEIWDELRSLSPMHTGMSYARLEAENGIVVGRGSRIMVTAGANMAFMHAVMAVTRPGDEVILPVPFYFNHEMAIEMAGCRPVPVRTDDRYQIDLEAIRAAVTPRTRAVVTVSPNNPSGAVLTGESLDRKSTRLNSSHSQQSRMPSSA